MAEIDSLKLKELGVKPKETSSQHLHAICLFTDLCLYGSFRNAAVEVDIKLDGSGKPGRKQLNQVIKIKCHD